MELCDNCAQPESCTSNGCFADKARSVAFSTAEAAARRHQESQQSRDMDAYKRMRQQGLQPLGVTGAHFAETLPDRHLIEGTPDPKMVEQGVNQLGGTELVPNAERFLAK